MGYFVDSTIFFFFFFFFLYKIECLWGVGGSSLQEEATNYYISPISNVIPSHLRMWCD